MSATKCFLCGADMDVDLKKAKATKAICHVCFEKGTKATPKAQLAQKA